jgi:hypothetical protein
MRKRDEAKKKMKSMRKRRRKTKTYCTSRSHVRLCAVNFPNNAAASASQPSVTAVENIIRVDPFGVIDNCNCKLLLLADGCVCDPSPANSSPPSQMMMMMTIEKERKKENEFYMVSDSWKIKDKCSKHKSTIVGAAAAVEVVFITI